jgi:hypothetical protein
MRLTGSWWPGRRAGLGDREAALYEGGGVAYFAGGGPDWLYLTLMLIAGVAAIAFWIALLARMLIRRRRRLASTPASSFSYSQQWSWRNWRRVTQLNGPPDQERP